MRAALLYAVFLCTNAADRPRISVTGNGEGTDWNIQKQTGELFGSKLHYCDVLWAKYGIKLAIYCTSTDSNRLNIKLRTFFWGGDVQNTEIVNATTIKLNINTAEYKYHENGVLNYDYSYICTDDETDLDVHLQLEVTPLLTVATPKVPQSGPVHYFVPLYEDYQLECSGHPSIVITKDKQEIQTISVNKTTIRSTSLSATEIGTLIYECPHTNRQVMRKFTSQASVGVYIDYPPKATDFWCVEFNLRINCTWSVLPQTRINFTLFYTNGSSIRVCEDHSANKFVNCEWSLKKVRKHGLKYDKELSLQMQSCNYFYCTNETYNINRDSITKAQTPVGFKLVKTNSTDALVTWKAYAIPVQYKITFRLTETEPKELNPLPYCVNNTCEKQLKLPCPGALYEIKIYVKLSTTPLQSAYWSDPARITFRTDPVQKNENITDPLCRMDSEMINNKVIAAYEVRKLERRFQIDGAALHNKVNSLKVKLDMIKKICREKSLDICERLLNGQNP